MKDRKGVEIRKGCLVKTKALNAGHQHYEYFKVLQIQNRLSIQRQDLWGNMRTYSLAYLRDWMRDDTLEVVMGAEMT
ncbi:MAG: hypothetical protein IJR54_02305 [Oscillibacter sp.]|nr:hypothetical protein [Oscillibacter sp.]